MSFVEDMMEHIAAGIGKDPESVKIANFNDVDKPVLMKMMEDLKKSADYDNRKAAVDTFNLVIMNSCLLNNIFNKSVIYLFRTIDGRKKVCPSCQ